MQMLRVALLGPARVEGDAEGVAASPRVFLPRGGCALLRARGLLAPALLVEAVQMLRVALLRPWVPALGPNSLGVSCGFYDPKR